jgi:hypothetical protein
VGALLLLLVIAAVFRRRRGYARAAPHTLTASPPTTLPPPPGYGSRLALFEELPPGGAPGGRAIGATGSRPRTPDAPPPGLDRPSGGARFDNPLFSPPDAMGDAGTAAWEGVMAAMWEVEVHGAEEGASPPLQQVRPAALRWGDSRASPLAPAAMHVEPGAAHVCPQSCERARWGKGGRVRVSELGRCVRCVAGGQRQHRHRHGRQGLCGGAWGRLAERLAVRACARQLRPAAASVALNERSGRHGPEAADHGGVSHTLGAAAVKQFVAASASLFRPDIAWRGPHARRACRPAGRTACYRPQDGLTG